MRLAGIVILPDHALHNFAGSSLSPADWFAPQWEMGHFIYFTHIK